MSFQQIPAKCCRHVPRSCRRQSQLRCAPNGRNFRLAWRANGQAMPAASRWISRRMQCWNGWRLHSLGEKYPHVLKFYTFLILVTHVHIKSYKHMQIVWIIWVNGWCRYIYIYIYAWIYIYMHIYIYTLTYIYISCYEVDRIWYFQ